MGNYGKKTSKKAIKNENLLARDFLFKYRQAADDFVGTLQKSKYSLEEVSMLKKTTSIMNEFKHNPDKLKKMVDLLNNKRTNKNNATATLFNFCKEEIISKLGDTAEEKFNETADFFQQALDSNDLEGLSASNIKAMKLLIKTCSSS